jgi:hypothetical protein
MVQINPQNIYFNKIEQELKVKILLALSLLKLKLNPLRVKYLQKMRPNLASNPKFLEQ